MPGRQVLQAALESLMIAEQSSSTFTISEEPLLVLTSQEINSWTTLPIPIHADWKKATQSDPDLLLISTVLQHKAELPKQQLINKQELSSTFSRNQFEYEDGILYYYEEPRKAHIRQIHTRVVPVSL
jgi:hypothetical protein